MALLSTHLRVRPGVIHAIVELVLVAKRPLRADRVIALLQPAAIGDVRLNDEGGDAAGEARSSSELVSDALGLCTAMGLLAESADGFSPSDAVARLDPTRLHEELRPVVSEMMLLVGGAEVSSGRVSMWRDLLESASWLLSQRIVRDVMGHEWFELRHHEQVESGSLYNATKRTALIDWGTYLGILSTDPLHADRLVADPTRAVRWVLGSVLADEMPVVEVLAALAERLCVLDGGSMRVALLEKIRPELLPWEHEQGVISPSLSLALYRLAREGFVVLRDRADTPQEKRRRMVLRDFDIDDVVDAIAPGDSFTSRRIS